MTGHKKKPITRWSCMLLEVLCSICLPCTPFCLLQHSRPVACHSGVSAALVSCLIRARQLATNQYQWSNDRAVFETVSHSFLCAEVASARECGSSLFLRPVGFLWRAVKIHTLSKLQGPERPVSTEPPFHRHRQIRVVLPLDTAPVCHKLAFPAELLGTLSFVRELVSSSSIM